MDDARTVQQDQRPCGFRGYPPGRRRRDAAGCPYQLRQRGGRDVVDGHPGSFGIRVRFLHGGRVRAVDPFGQCHLAREAPPVGVGDGALRQQCLDGDELSAPARPGQVNPAHSARGQPAEKPVRPQLHRIVTVQRIDLRPGHLFPPRHGAGTTVPCQVLERVPRGGVLGRATELDVRRLERRVAEAAPSMVQARPIGRMVRCRVRVRAGGSGRWCRAG